MDSVQRENSLSSFVTLEILLPGTKCSSAGARHYLYLRRHEPRTPQPESSRSMFCANIPVDSTETHFRELFSSSLDAGRVERVDFDDVPSLNRKKNTIASGSRVPSNRKRKREARDHGPLIANLPNTWERGVHKSGGTCVIVFIDKASLKLSLDAIEKVVKRDVAVQWGVHAGGQIPRLGLPRFLNHLSMQYPSLSELQPVVDNFMTEYAQREAADERERARKRQVPDADGFITVTRGGRSTPAAAKAAQETLERLNAKEEQKRRSLGNFYRFQVREKKKDDANELLKKFTDSRRKIEDVKQRSHKFKPI